MNLKQRAVAAVIGGALAFAPTPPAAAFPIIKPAVPVAAEPQKGNEKTTEGRLDDLQRDVKRLTELLEGRRDGDGYKNPFDRGLVAEVTDLKNKVRDLEREIATLKSSTSLRPSITGPAADPMAGKGTVRVVNDYPVEIRIAVNSTSFTVAPGTKLDIPVPVGEFTYQLLNAGANLTPTRSPVKEKEVVTLRIK
jgi:hypothetical protein